MFILCAMSLHASAFITPAAPGCKAAIQFIPGSERVGYCEALSARELHMSSLTTPAGRLLLIVTACGFLLGACGHEPVRRTSPGHEAPARVTPRPTTRTIGERVAVVALRQVGVPYRYGGQTRNGFDCSGLVRYSYSAVGQQVPRSTRDQWRNLAPVPKNRLQVGDVLFFRIKGAISHVGIYLGNERFVHAPSSGRSVGVASLDSGFYRNAFVRGGRPAISSN